ncbi:DUF2510 domain-containing protein [Streptomyces nodosus]|uniref:DUF2510 domain-containing protein n=1 Tax=Streptomyces nodosus TaxID=40318 RepID=UPI00380D794D
MTQVTPPGWYPDPGQTSDGPATERWWDGKAWTDHVRPAEPAAPWGPPGQAQAVGGPPGFGAQPGAPFGFPYPGAPPSPARRRIRIGAAVAAAVLVLAGIGGGVYALTAHDGGGNPAAAPGQGGSGGQEGRGGGPFGGPGGSGGSGGPGGEAPVPQRSGQPGIEDGYATDLVNGISIPVPDGWSGGTIDGGAALDSTHQYACPGDTSQSCTTGGAYSASAEAQGLTATTAEAAAKQDIAKNAEESYGTGYGGITSHKVLASRAVTVAGQQGYLVRWKAVTGKGSDGYVESLVFPSPANTARLVVIRMGIDVGKNAPDPSVLDQIAQGVKAASAGDGQHV